MKTTCQISSTVPYKYFSLTVFSFMKKHTSLSYLVPFCIICLCISVFVVVFVVCSEKTYPGDVLINVRYKFMSDSYTPGFVSDICCSTASTAAGYDDDMISF